MDLPHPGNRSVRAHGSIGNDATQKERSAHHKIAEVWPTIRDSFENQAEIPPRNAARNHALKKHVGRIRMGKADDATKTDPRCNLDCGRVR